MPAENPVEMKSALEARMGELASLLSEVAEALAYYPGELLITDGAQEEQARPRDALVVNAREWPSIQEIEQLIANWRALSNLARV